MLGSLLIQPQVLARIADPARQRSEAEDLADEILALLHRIVLDPAAMAAIVPAGKAAGDAMGARLATLVQPNLPRGLAALQALFAPLVARFEALGQGPSSAPDLLARMADALEALAGATGSLSDDAIRAFVRRAAHIAQNDFGLDLRAIAAEAKRFVADFRTRIGNEGAAGTAATRHALACLLGRVERDLLPQLPQIDFAVDFVADLAIGELRRTGLADLRDQANCLLGKIEAVLRAVAEMARLLAARGLPRAAPAPLARADAAPLARSAPGRGDDATFCWYASWLYAKRRQGSGTGTSDGHIFLQVVTNIFTLNHYPHDEVWHSADRKSLVLRRAAGADEILHRAEAPFEWYEAPQFSGDVPAPPFDGAAHAEHFLMRRIEGPFLETWTHVSSILANFTIGLVHLIQLATSPNEFAVNAQRWMWTWVNACVSTTHVPLPSLIAWKAGTGVGLKFVFSPLLVMIGTALGGLEGKHSKTNGDNIFLQYLTLLGGDALGAVKNDVVVTLVHDFFLSLFTLINNDGPRDAPADGSTDLRPCNRDMSGPVVSLVNALLGMLFIKMVRREDHGLPPAGSLTRFVLWCVVGAPLMAFVGTFSGVLVGWGIARATTLKQLWQEPLLAAAIGLVMSPVTLYNALEGDTDDGRYNPNIDPQGNAFAVPRLPFNGYAPASTSPYRLPYAAGTVSFIGQAHQGFFSHMRYGQTVQVYAYDFAHDFQDEILCVRDGVVVDYFDWITDDIDPNFNQLMAAVQEACGLTATPTAAQINAAAVAGLPCLLVPGQSGAPIPGVAGSGDVGVGGGGGVNQFQFTWNFITVRHTAVDNAHDLDQGGGVVTTFAQYGHGAKGGVRAAFLARGVQPRNIIGTVVRQGDVLMLAGDTGTSFHNHLHLHVLPQGTPAQATQPPPLNAGNLPPYTLPFVFREARHVLGRDGPLRHLTWYTSENPRLG